MNPICVPGNQAYGSDLHEHTDIKVEWWRAGSYSADICRDYRAQSPAVGCYQGVAVRRRTTGDPTRPKAFLEFPTLLAFAEDPWGVG